MKKKLRILTMLWVVFATTFISISCADNKVEYRRLPVKVYRDKMKAGWIGQMVGVSWFAPTEFRYRDRIIPLEEVPIWKPETIHNSFPEDDLFVEMTFLRSLEEYGLDVSIRQAGIDFANSTYWLACANAEGRKNLRAGIAPPDASHPQFNYRSCDIDYMIESDYAGLIAPGMPNAGIELGNKFGRLMNYGDGVYGGQFVSGMYCEAFFEDDIMKIIEAGLACIPAESHFAEMVRDMIAWYNENPDDWVATWEKCQKKYREDPEYQQSSNGGIDVRINGAYILMGLLYGKSDLDQTNIISARCGQDSDCNPSNAACVLFTTVGFEKLPSRFTEALDYETNFLATAYNMNSLLDVCEKLTREFVIREGGRIEIDANGDEVFVIPVKTPIPNQVERSWVPGPLAGDTYFTDEENTKILYGSFAVQAAVDRLFSGWTIGANGQRGTTPGYHASLRGKSNVLVTNPVSRDAPCTLTNSVEVPVGRTTTLRLVVGHHEEGDWNLNIRVNGSSQKNVNIDNTLTKDTGWAEVTYDLTSFAGDKVTLDLENNMVGRTSEGYWAEIEIKTQ